VKPAKQTPLKDVKDSIKQQLLQTKKTDAMNAWVDQMKKDFSKKVRYQAGYEPTATATTGSSTTTPPTTTG
jgi:hypothetical protein